MTEVLVVSHADADGHLIAEQTRRNLSLIDTFRVRTVVDPARTKDHKVWTKLDTIEEIADAELVFFVDLMFAPATFAEEATALVDFVQRRPEKQFFLIDHHPLPLRRLERAKNLRAVYRPDVFECSLGPRSGMMVVAALCENQGQRVADIKQPQHDILAVGMRRAAAHGGGTLAGEKLLALLRADCWESLAQLGTEDREHHYLPRGRRPPNRRPSKMLRALDDTAEKLLGHRPRTAISASRSRGSVMAYDFDVGQERYFIEAGDQRSLTRNARPNPKDLETIVTLLEVAAIELTVEPDDTFTLDELVRRAHEIGGGDVDLDKRDVQIVLDKSSFLEKVGGELRLK